MQKLDTASCWESCIYARCVRVTLSLQSPVPRHRENQLTVKHPGLLLSNSGMLDSNNTFKASCGGVLSALCFGLAGVGLLRSVACTTGALRFLWRKHLRPGKKLNSYGEWAVVTGASDGIGRAYCDYLARQGKRTQTDSADQTCMRCPGQYYDMAYCEPVTMPLCVFPGVSNAGLNIFLVSRTKAKLETAAAEIGQEHDVKTRILAVDLAIAGSQGLDAEVWANLRTAVAGMDVAVLVNNAATIQRHPSDFHMLDAGSIDYTVSLNDTAILKLTHLVLPGMVERGRGAIVNISTIVCKFPAAPQLALYTASKSFLNTFTKALAAEYGPKGIHVQVCTQRRNFQSAPTLASSSPYPPACQLPRFVPIDITCVPWCHLEVSMSYSDTNRQSIADSSQQHMRINPFESTLWVLSGTIQSAFEHHQGGQCAVVNRGYTSHVQVQLPGPVATSLVPTGTPESGFMPSPKDFVAHAGRHIGYETVCIPYPHHAVATCAPLLAPAHSVHGHLSVPWISVSCHLGPTLIAACGGEPIRIEWLLARLQSPLFHILETVIFRNHWPDAVESAGTGASLAGPYAP